MINKKSGVAGLVGGSSDMRDLEAAVEAGDERATMVLDVYNYRIKKYIGAYAAAMGGCDILVWTGGVGENQWATRRVVLLEQGNVVIMSGGTGNPFFTTDTGSSLRGIEIEADVMLKGTRVDGIYTADPEKDPTATKVLRYYV